MKVSREQVARNRQQIIEVASKLFREKGFDGIGVADIMHSAGLTHGGFYGHFASKDDLAAQASAGAFSATVGALEAAEESGSSDQLEAFVASYLSPRHRDDTGGGCVLAALGSDAGRQRGAVRGAFTEGLRATISRLMRIAPGRSQEAQRQKALATLAGLVGALTLARAVDDPELSDEFLNAGVAAFGGVATGKQKRSRVADKRCAASPKANRSR
jgi:TetR/AcrR family transcriptional repressor of nem operon